MTITNLTIRQYLRSKAVWVITLVLMLPIISGLVVLFQPDEYNLNEVRRMLGNAIFMQTWAPTLLPLAALILASAAFGDEIDDKTLHFLTLKPVSRFRIVLEKWLAMLLVALAISSIVVVIMWLVTGWGRLDGMSNLILPIIAAMAVGILGYGSLFLMLSLVVRRALVVGVFYVFIWESLLTRFLPGLRNVSISHYVKSTFSQLLDDRRIQYEHATSLQNVILMLVIVVVGSLALAVWRLRTMAID